MPPSLECSIGFAKKNVKNEAFTWRFQNSAENINPKKNTSNPRKLGKICKKIA